MSGMEDQLGAILSDPEMMAKIQSLARSLGQPEEPPKHAEAPQKGASPPSTPSGVSAGDLEMVKAFTGFARGMEIDKDQRALLKALSPYVSREKTAKLERAMRAAKLAQQATGLMESGALKKLTGV